MRRPHSGLAIVLWILLASVLGIWMPRVAGAEAADGAGSRPPGSVEPIRLLPEDLGASLGLRLSGRADSCRVEWTEPFYYLWDWAQQRCEATRCELTESREIAAVSVVLYNYGDAPAEKGIRVFLLADAGGTPGATLWSAVTTTTLLPAGETREVGFAVDPPVGPIGPGPFWLGHEELAPGPPSSLFDGAVDALHNSSQPPCGNWTEQDLGDYLQFLPMGSPSGVSVPSIPSSASVARWRSLNQPARGRLRVELELAWSQAVTLGLYSLSGRRVESLLFGERLAAGVSVRTFDAERFPSGVYLLRLDTPGAQLTRKVLVLH